MLAKLKHSKGFTIIEVMIVLAIAGLIILIVLLAVPALQRNGRNTAIKNDASAIVAGISTFSSDNDGQGLTATTDISPSGSTVTIGPSGSAQAQAKIQGGTTVTPTMAGGIPSTAIVPGTLLVHIKETCSGQPSNRAVAVWYAIETASAPSPVIQNNRCVEG